MQRKIELEACPAGMVPRHTHDDVHACFIFGGAMNDRLFGDEVISVGEICVNPAGTEHWIEAAAEGLECAIISWPSAMVMPVRKTVCVSDQLRNASGLIDKLSSSNPAERLIAEGELGSAIENSIAEKFTESPSWLVEARALINKSPQGTVVASLANDAGVHRATFTRWFQRAYGISPEHYRMLIQLEQSAALLLRGDTPAHVALEVGFADQSHFNRAWRHYLGGTPGHWAKSHATIIQDVSRNDGKVG